VVKLDAKTAFDNLAEKERLYAHHMSRAAFYGGLVVLPQVTTSAGMPGGRGLMQGCQIFLSTKY
jgi:hypothetical protein